MRIRSLVMGLVLFALATFAAPQAKAWNCSNPLDARVAVPTGTPGTFGDGTGQLFLGKVGEGTPGVLYECEPPQPLVPSVPAPSNSTSSASSAANSSSNSASAANASSNQSQKQQQTQNQTATGGTASATGGNASIGNVSSTSTVSNSGNSTLKNSGNSSNKNTNTATGGNQSQTSTSSANGNGVGNGNNSNDTTINNPRQVPMAYAPTVIPTISCFKGYSGGASTGLFGASFGGGKIDTNCAELEAARQAPSLLARCKVYLTNKYVREAGVTLEDCLPPPPPPVILDEVLPPTQAPITINMPAPVVTVIPGPAAPPQVDVAAASKKIVHRHAPCKCVVTNDSIRKQ